MPIQRENDGGDVASLHAGQSCHDVGGVVDVMAVVAKHPLHQLNDIIVVAYAKNHSPDSAAASPLFELSVG